MDWKNLADEEEGLAQSGWHGVTRSEGPMMDETTQKQILSCLKDMRYYLRSINQIMVVWFFVTIITAVYWAVSKH